MNDMGRKYELRKRAEAMDETRQRITEAAVELHGTVGPARTTVSAVAERAGVQRHTVYRHFPTEDELFAACSRHFVRANPWPDPGEWQAIEDPRERLDRALDELYRYYDRTAYMWSRAIRDRDLVAAMEPHFAPFDGYMAEAAGVLAAGWPVRGSRRRVLVAAIRHALNFASWQSLVAGGDLSRDRAVRLMAALVESACEA